MLFSVSITVQGQDSPADTLRFKMPNGKTTQTFHYDTSFTIKTPDIPSLFPDTTKLSEKNRFQDRSWTRFNLEEGLKPLPNGQKYLTYSSANDAFHYSTYSDPILLGFDFHLKPLTHWEKFDIYSFGAGMLTYTGDTFFPADQNTKAFIWQAGGGIEYELKNNVSLFYEFSGVFKNKSLSGTIHKPGARFRF